MDTSVNKDFFDWLASNNPAPFPFRDRYCGRAVALIVIRVPKNESFDFLFAQKEYEDSGLSTEYGFKCVGIYCKSDGKLYGIGQMPFDSILRLMTTAGLRGQLKRDVAKRVESIIGNDRKKLKITKLTDLKYIQKLDYFVEYEAQRMARITLFMGNSPASHTFQCLYEPKVWTDETLMEYILTPDMYVEKEAWRYIDGNQDEILYYFLCNDAEQREYDAIAESPRNPVLIAEQIKSVMNDSPAKTINVTIQKDGVEFVFDADAAAFRNSSGNKYFCRSIVEKQREKFRKMFGRDCTGYLPEEIVRITYGRKVLYEAAT